MLFVVTHEHSAETCPAGNPTMVVQTIDEKHISESGVKVLGAYVAPSEHTLYYIIEADEYSQVVRYLRPLLPIGTADIVPVQTIQEAAGIFPTR